MNDVTSHEGADQRAGRLALSLLVGSDDEGVSVFDLELECFARTGSAFEIGLHSIYNGTYSISDALDVAVLVKSGSIRQRWL